MATKLVSLSRVKDQLQIMQSDSTRDPELQFKIEQASAIVLSHIKASVVPDGWLSNTSPITYDIPIDVQSAVLLIVSELYLNREASTANVLSEAVVSLLSPYRTPTLA